MNSSPVAVCSLPFPLVTQQAALLYRVIHPAHYLNNDVSQDVWLWMFLNYIYMMGRGITFNFTGLGCKEPFCLNSNKQSARLSTVVKEMVRRY